jgi:hypothetical protein
MSGGWRFYKCGPLALPGVATYDLLLGPGASASAAGYVPEGKNLPSDSVTIHAIASQPIWRLVPVLSIERPVLAHPFRSGHPTGTDVIEG